TTSLPDGGTGANLVLTLWDSAGNAVAYGWSWGWGDSQAVLEVAIPRNGTYYLGVSADPNYGYDPFTAGSGWAVADPGDYSLEMSLGRLPRALPGGPVGGGGAPVHSVRGHAVW